MNTPLLQEDLVRLAERTETDACIDFTTAAPPREAAALGIEYWEYHGAVALMAAGIDELALNRIVNLGQQVPASEPLLDALMGEYRSARVPRFMVQLAPGARPPQLDGWLTERGFTPYDRWTRLHRALDSLPVVETALRVERVGDGDAEIFAEIVAAAYGWPADVRPWIAASVGRPGWRHYLAWDGPTPVATGAMFIIGQVGWMGFAATAAEHRGRGAQTALIAHRLRDAREAGCHRLVVETAEDRPDHPSPAFHNLRRLDFVPAYSRTNYLWRAG